MTQRLDGFWHMVRPEKETFRVERIGGRVLLGRESEVQDQGERDTAAQREVGGSGRDGGRRRDAAPQSDIARIAARGRDADAQPEIGGIAGRHREPA
jgi:hypothetical protein